MRNAAESEYSIVHCGSRGAPARVLEEIGRPAFSALPRPLHELCQYLSYGDLEKAMEQYREVLRHLQPAFLAEIAQSASAR